MLAALPFPNAVTGETSNFIQVSITSTTFTVNRNSSFHSFGKLTPFTMPTMEPF